MAGVRRRLDMPARILRVRAQRGMCMDGREKLLRLRAIELELADLDKKKQALLEEKLAILEIRSSRLEKPTKLSREEQQRILRQTAFGRPQ